MDDMDDVARLAEKVTTMGSLFSDEDYEVVAEEVVPEHSELQRTVLASKFAIATSKIMKDYPDPGEMPSGISPQIYRDFAERLISVHQRHEKAA